MPPEISKIIEGTAISNNLMDAYRRTLVERPLGKCLCSGCSRTGIDALTFRGYNRNKRRGLVAH
jgi:hypothetical protein